MQYRFRPLYMFKPTFLTEEISTFEDSFLGKWGEIHTLAEKTELYHYTNLDGLRGILEHRALWLGHISCLNDPSELQYGRRIINEAIDAVLQRETDNLSRKFILSLSNFVQASATTSTHHTFLTCFCESGNLLSQWQVYAHSGEGYCIGFEFSSATRIKHDLVNLGEGKEPYLRKVIYNEKLQHKLVQEYLDGLLVAARAALNRRDDQRFSDAGANATVMAVQAASVLMDMLICFKHPAFESENEWRLLRSTREDFEPEGLQFRVGGGELTPYRPMHIYNIENDKPATFPARSVGLGPKLEPGRTRSTVQLLLLSMSTGDHPIKLDPHLRIYSAGYSLRREQ
jgi:hypothetical protein